MSVILILVVVSVAVAAVFLLLFIRAVYTGQYDDDYSPAVRILFEPEGQPDHTDKQTDSH